MDSRRLSSHSQQQPILANDCLSLTTNRGVAGAFDCNDGKRERDEREKEETVVFSFERQERQAGEKALTRRSITR